MEQDEERKRKDFPKWELSRNAKVELLESRYDQTILEADCSSPS